MPKTTDFTDLLIDEDLYKALPRPTAEAKDELLQQIISDGRIRDPIVVWKDKGIIVDGMTRAEIWPQIPDPFPKPTVEEKDFQSLDDAIRWARWNQLNRRNLTPQQMCEMRGLVYESEKQIAEENLAPGTPDDPSRCQNDTASETPKKQGSTEKSDGRTRDRVARQTGVSPSTVARDAKYASALQRIESVNAKAASDIRSGTLKVKKNDVIAIGQLFYDKDIGAALRNIRAGRDWLDDGKGKPEKKKTTKKPEKKTTKKPEKKTTKKPENKPRGNPKGIIADIQQSVKKLSRQVEKAQKELGASQHVTRVMKAIDSVSGALSSWKASV